MAEEGGAKAAKDAEKASTASPEKKGVDIAAAASASASSGTAASSSGGGGAGGGGAGGGTEDAEGGGEDDAEVDPKVSGDNKKKSMANASSPYAKPEEAHRPPAGQDGVSQNRRRVYVGNLSWSVTWRELKDHMRGAGEVVRADVLTGYDGRSKGCGIVEYVTAEEADVAVETLNNTDLLGRQIFVREDREERMSSSSAAAASSSFGGGAAADAGGGGARGGGGGGGGGSMDGNGGGGGAIAGKSVYVGNLSYEVAWQDLKDHMRTAGDVVYAEVMTMHDGRSKGCGIVEFATPEGAQEAIEKLNDTDLKGRTIFVREDREQQQQGGGGGPREGDGGFTTGGGGGGGGWQRAGGRGGYGNLSVYVGNLAYETSWQDLKDHMRAAGNVDKADILKSDDGRSKGCGIVLYQKSHESARAIRELQNTELNGRPIFVREDREHGHNGHHNHHGGYNANNNNRGHHGHHHGGYQQQQGHHNHHQQHRAGFMPGAPAEEGCQLFVGNLSWETGWRELKDHFRQCGEVDRAEVAEGSDGRKRGFGLIRFHTAKDAQKAIEELSGVELDGRPLEVRVDNKA